MDYREAQSRATERAAAGGVHPVEPLEDPDEVFFLDAGTVTSSSKCIFPQDEADPFQTWEALARLQNVELIICVSSALRHGMLDTTEAKRHERGQSTIRPGFTISGLGQLVDACASSDRIITFGG